MAKIKNATSTDILNLSKKIYKPTEVIITAIDGTEFKIAINKMVSQSKVTELITEYIQHYEWCVGQEIPFIPIQVTYILILKHFTSIAFPQNQKEKSRMERYAIELQTLEALVELGLLSQILEHFSEKNLNLLTNAFKNYEVALREYQSEKGEGDDALPIQESQTSTETHGEDY